MTGPAQRGYVASASSVYDGGDASAREPYNAFGSHTVGSGSSIRWRSANNSGTLGSFTGAWLKLELPHKIVLSQIKYYAYHSGFSPESYVILASNDDSTWVKLHDATGQTNGTFTISSFSEGTPSTPYKYYAFLTRIITNSGTAVIINDLHFYGTGVDSIPIQIGGGNIDKVANFRVYDKFVGEDQALEIWDAQKDEFGRTKSSMTLQKGRLGIGTTEPQGRLAVLDEPNGLEEFPPKPLAGYKTYIEGHGEFCVSVSNVLSESYTGYKAFNKNSTGTSNNWWTQSDQGGQPEYSTSTGRFSSTDSLYATNVEGVITYGQWLQIEFPYKINYKYSDIQAPHHSIGRQPRVGYIVGSNDLSGVWTSLHRFTDVFRTHKYESVIYTPPTVSTQTFKYFRLVIEELNNYQYAGIARWDIFGTREQGQSVLHDGQLTLTKNLNVPRIGPALDADDTPRRDRLVVEYNTSTNPTFEGAVRDTSGRGNDGIIQGDVSYDATEKAFTGFTRVSSKTISTPIHNTPGDYNFSVSTWVKPLSYDGNQGIFNIGPPLGTSTNTRGQTAVRFESSGVLKYYVWGYGANNSSYTYKLGEWIHIVATYSGGSSGQKLYVDGAELNLDAGTQGELDLLSGAHLHIGHLVNGTGALYGDRGLNGSISNLKLYDTALTAQEVKTLYDMGRLGNGLYPLHIDAPVHINGPLYAPGAILNISQFVDDTDRQVISSTSQVTGYTTPPIHMKAGSKVKLDFYIPWRHDGTNLTSWRGGYHWIYFRLNKTVAGVAANTFVMLLSSGYHMVNGASAILTYVNNVYLPLSVPEDYTIEFQHRFAAYTNTSTPFRINQSHNINASADANLLKLGFPNTNMGWSKYIITEISK